MSPILWTIGHSTRRIDEFLALLQAHHIQQLVDVRTIPRSRHNPQFNTEVLAKSLKHESLNYRHLPELGGLRKAKKDSINTGWRNTSFRGYADYMQTDEFWKALDELIAVSQSRRTAIMCAEAVPWRCHRSLIADALLTRSGEVRHIMSETKADPHQLTSFAAVEKGLLHYPSPKDNPRLFP
jgi:uncharacterized protein (DUF488 family)